MASIEWALKFGKEPSTGVLFQLGALTVAIGGGTVGAWSSASGQHRMHSGALKIAIDRGTGALKVANIE